MRSPLHCSPRLLLHTTAQGSGRHAAPPARGCGLAAARRRRPAAGSLRPAAFGRRLAWSGPCSVVGQRREGDGDPPGTGGPSPDLCGVAAGRKRLPLLPVYVGVSLAPPMAAYLLRAPEAWVKPAGSASGSPPGRAQEPLGAAAPQPLRQRSLLWDRSLEGLWSSVLSWPSVLERECLARQIRREDGGGLGCWRSKQWWLGRRQCGWGVRGRRRRWSGRQRGRECRLRRGSRWSQR